MPGYVAGTQKSLRVQVGEKQENPAARLKLLLVCYLLSIFESLEYSADGVWC